MPYKTIQQKFTKGELNPKLQGRSDVEMYYSSANRMRNVVSIPFGGFTRRSGLEYVDTLANQTEIYDYNVVITTPNGGTGANANDGDRGTIFTTNNLGTTSPFVAIQYDLGSAQDIVYVDLLDVGLNTSQATATATLTTNSGIDVYSWSFNDGIDEFTLDLISVHGATTGDTFTVTYDDGAGNTYTRDVVVTVVDTDTVTYTDATFDSEGSYEPSTIVRLQASVASIAVDDGGKGYDSGSPPTVTVVGDGTGATASATVNASGVITSISVDTAGDDYTYATITIEDPSAEGTFKAQGSANGSSWTDIGTSFNVDEDLKDLRIEGTFSYRYFRVLRTDSDDIKAGFTCSEFNLYQDLGSQSNVKTFAFSFNREQSYILAVTAGNIAVYSDTTKIIDVPAPKITALMIPDLKYAQSADTAIFVHEDLEPQKLVREGALVWSLSDLSFDSIPKYNFDATTPSSPSTIITPDALEGVVNITANSPVFTSDSVIGQYIDGGGGRVKITARNSTTQVVGYTIIPFYTTNPIGAGSWTLTTDYESVWSSTRGYPRTVAFYGGRLWFGGSKSRPQTIWGSQIGLFTEFASAGAYDNDAIDVTIDTDQVNQIINIYSQRGLTIYTSGGEFAILQNFGEPITPSNITIRRQTKNGSWEKTEPVDVSGIIFFIEQEGNTLVSFIYDDNQLSYTSANYSILNSHLIDEPLSMDVQYNVASQDANYIYIVNDDGTCCVDCIVVDQDVNGYSLITTDGEFKAVTVNDDGVYFIIERTINGSDVLFLEKINEDMNTDAGVYEEVSSPTTTLSGLSYLEGEELDVKVDGEYIGTKTVSSGSIALGTTANETIEAGIPYTIQVKSNPLEISQMGVGIGKIKRIPEMTIRFTYSRNILVNGDEATLNNVENEDYTWWGIGDWSEKESFEITQSEPYDLTVLAVQMQVNYEVSKDG